MKQGDILNSMLSVTGTTTGAVTSRIVADSVPIENEKVKHGVLAGIAVVGAMFLDRKTPVSSFAQDVAIGVSATQLGYLLKSFFPEAEGTLKTGLGNPKGQFLASPDAYDFIPTAPRTVETPHEVVATQIMFR